MDYSSPFPTRQFKNQNGLSWHITVFKDAEWSDLANHVVGNSGVRIETGHSRIITHTNWVMYWYEPHSGGDERVMINVALHAGMGQALPIPVHNGLAAELHHVLDINTFTYVFILKSII
jgi:hypothetical protein